MVDIKNYYIIIKIHYVITILLWNIYNIRKIKKLAFHCLLKYKLFNK